MDSVQTSKHLKLFNPILNPDQTLDSFSRFSDLPKELQLHIWELVLSRSRLLDLRAAGDEPTNSDSREDGEQAGTRVGDVFIVSGHNILSKVLHINRDARHAALHFYRVHLPCNFVRVGDGRFQSGILYLNPEWDILHLRSGFECRNGMRLVDFLLQVKSLDCSGVGLLHLALSNESMKHLRPRSSQLSCATRTAYVSAIESLQSVYFLSLERFGRTYIGVLSGVAHTRGWEFHRSRPIFSSTSILDKLPRDPRPIENDLRRVFVGRNDPRIMVYNWEKYLLLWGAQVKREYHFMISFEPVEPILDRGSAISWIKREDARWTRLQLENREEIESRNGTFPIESSVELELAPQPAVGFWVFPIDVIGKLPDVKQDRENSPISWRSRGVLDMSKYWPELWVSVLPQY